MTQRTQTSHLLIPLLVMAILAPILAFSGPVQAQGPIVSNGDFASGDAGWRLTQLSGSTGTFDASDGIASVAVMSTSGVSATITLRQGGLDIASASRHCLRFAGRAGVPGPIEVALQKNRPNFANIAPRLSIELTPDWQSFEIEIVPSAADADARLAFLLGQAARTVDLDDISLTPSPCVTSGFGDLVSNGDYAAGSDGWGLFAYGGSVASLSTASGSATITVAQPPSAAASLTLRQGNIVLPSTETHCLQFDARASISGPIEVVFQKNYPGFTDLGVRFSPDLDGNWQTFKATFHPNQADDNSRLTFRLGQSARTIEIDNVSLSPEACRGPVTPPPLGLNLLSNPSFEALSVYSGGWSLFRNGSSAIAALDFVAIPDGIFGARVIVNNPGPTQDRVQWRQAGLSVADGTTMCVSFRARATAPAPISMRLLDNISPFDNLGLDVTTTPLTATWQAYSFEFIVARDAPDARLAFVLGQVQRSVYIDDVDIHRCAAGPGAAIGETIGVSAGSFVDTLSDPELRADMAHIESLGASWVRVDVNWRQVEPVQGTYNWSVPDDIIGAAVNAGLNVIGVLTYRPDWAEVVSPAAGQPPFDQVAFGSFAGAAAARYAAQGVNTWEIWNEPNIADFWSGPPDAAAYVSALTAASDAIRGSAPGARVITGGLAPTATVAGDGIAPVDFVQSMYNAGAASTFDGVGLHPYSFPEVPSFNAPWNLFYRMTDVRAIMTAHGDSAKQIWATEIGAPTGTSPQAVSLAQQQAIVVEAVRCQAALPWLGPMFIFQHRDRPGGTPLDSQDNFGLAYTDRSPKPAWTALQQLLAQPTSTATCPL